MKKKILIPFIAIALICFFYVKNQSNKNESLIISSASKVKLKDKPENARVLYAIEREKYELSMQRNPVTGEIPLEEKEKEYNTSLDLMQQNKFRKTTSSTYVSRGPSNFGGRTRAFAVDVSDATSKTMLSGGISSGLFRTTDGGES